MAFFASFPSSPTTSSAGEKTRVECQLWEHYNNTYWTVFLDGYINSSFCVILLVASSSLIYNFFLSLFVCLFGVKQAKKLLIQPPPHLATRSLEKRVVFLPFFIRTTTACYWSAATGFIRLNSISKARRTGGRGEDGGEIMCLMCFSFEFIITCFLPSRFPLFWLCTCCLYLHSLRDFIPPFH
jgi:hypothetical protein